MPSLAELFGFARPSVPWNSYPAQPETPEAFQTPPAAPWWLQSVRAPSPQLGLTSTFPRPLDAASFDSNAPSGGILGNFLAGQGAANASPSGGILQGLFPDAPPPSGGILGNLTPPSRGSNAIASGGVLPSVFPETTPDANLNAANWPGSAPFFLRGGDPLGSFNSSAGSPFAPHSLPSWSDAAPWTSQSPPDEKTSWPAPSLSSTARRAPTDDQPNNMGVGSRPVADFRPSQFSPPGQIAVQGLNDEIQAPASTLDAPVDTAPKPEAGDSDASFARGYDRAQALIAADAELSTAMRMAENSGDMGFHDRLATIVANLEQNPGAALDAVQREVFASKWRSMQTGSATDFNSAHATRKAVDRLDALWPKLDIVSAREDALEPFRRYSEDQIRTFNRIWHSPMSVQERRELLDREGLFDLALASDWAIGFALPGRVFGPPDRPGGGAGNSPPRSKANLPRIDETREARSASESSGVAPTQKPADPKVDRTHIEELRSRIRVPDRQTVGVARTNVPGLEDMKFEGASPQVRYEAGLPRANPGPIVTPSPRAFDRAHAEEDIANQFVRAVEERGLKPSDLDGYKLRIHISNPNGICAVCRWGLDSDRPPGVLKQLSKRYPDLTIGVTVETRPGITPRGAASFEIQNGRYISRSDQ